MTGARTSPGALLSREDVVLLIIDVQDRLLPRYAVHVVSDAVGSRGADDRQVAIRRMMQSGVTITSTEMLICELLGDADAEEFSAVLELVKET